MTTFEKWLEGWVYRPAEMTKREIFIARAAFIAGSMEHLCRPTKRAADSASRGGVFLEPKGSHESDPFEAQDKPQNR